ncbi:MAG: response regulator transcription factor [Chloroflexota bacterium]|jgi:two-component system alkaline phosphatase synthesis response regulator PhoP
MSQRILIADDDAQIVRLVKSYLEKDGFAVLTAFDGEQALHILRAERPDLAVLDVMMPKRDGFALVKLVRSDPQLASTPIFMLTARVEDNDKLHGLNMGADDYLTKPFNPREVVARVKAILRRANGQVRPSSLLQVRGLSLDVEQRSIALNGQLLELTPTEYDLLRTLMQNTNYAFTRGELIEKALGFGYDGFDRTIDSHIKNLRRKMEPDPTKPIYIETVFGVGYKLSRT